MFDHSWGERKNASFNQGLDGWATSQVTDMYRMFRQAGVFNRVLSRWCGDTAAWPQRSGFRCDQMVRCEAFEVAGMSYKLFTVYVISALFTPEALVVFGETMTCSSELPGDGRPPGG